MLICFKYGKTIFIYLFIFRDHLHLFSGNKSEIYQKLCMFFIENLLQVVCYDYFYFKI